MKKNLKSKELTSIELDYVSTSEDDDNMYMLKQYILHELPTQEKNILLLYLEYESYVEVAKMLNCSTPTASKYIKQIINKIRTKFNDTEFIIDNDD